MENNNIEPHNDPKIWSKAKEHKRWLELRHEYTLEAEIMNHKTLEDKAFDWLKDELEKLKL